MELPQTNECERCSRWVGQLMPVIVIEAGPKVDTGGVVERLPIPRKVSICSRCMKEVEFYAPA